MFDGILPKAVAMVKDMLSSDELSTHALELYSPHDVYERAQRRREQDVLSAVYYRPLPIVVSWTSGILVMVCMVLSFAALSVGGLFAAIIMFSAACLAGGLGAILAGYDEKSLLIKKQYQSMLAAAPEEVMLNVTISSTIEHPSSQHPRLVTNFNYDHRSQVLESIELKPTSDDIPAIAARCRVRNQASLSQLGAILAEGNNNVKYTLPDNQRQQLSLAQSMLQDDSVEVVLPPEQALIETNDRAELPSGQ